MSAPIPNSAPRRCFGLLTHRPGWLLTGRGWLVLILLLLALFFTVLLGSYPYLAPNNPFPDGPVSVEGWAGRPTLRAAIDEFRRHQYPVLLFTGGPIEEDSLLYQYGTYPDLGLANALKLGLTEKEAVTVPAPWVERDRTYTSALTLRAWLEKQGPLPRHLTVVSSGVHSRRSRALFQKAFGKETEVGIIAVPDSGFDPRHWWTTSEGFRTVTDEIIAYLYVTVFFWKS